MVSRAMIDLASRQLPQVLTLVLLLLCLIGIIQLVRRGHFSLWLMLGLILVLVNNILFYIYVLFIRGGLEFSNLSTNWSAIRSLHAAITLAGHVWLWLRSRHA